MKVPVFFAMLLLATNVFSQSILVKDNNGEDNIRDACLIVRINSPELYEAITQHAFIQRYSSGANPLSSTCYFDGENNSLWILIGTENISTRSVYRLAGTIYHESLHLLFTLERKRKGEEFDFSKLSPNIRKQEEIFVYKKTRELLEKIGTPMWELREYDQWVEGAKNRRY